MFYDESIAMRPGAERAATFASALLGSLDDAEQAEILKWLDELFEALATLLGYYRQLTHCGPNCSRFIWFPIEGGSGPHKTDMDFIDDPRLLEQPAYLELTKCLSRNRPDLAHRLIICVLVMRDWSIGDYESIQNAQDIIDGVQLAVIQDAARRRAGQRIGGRKKTGFA